MKPSSAVGLVVVLVAAGALLASGREGTAAIVGIGGAFLVLFWHKVLGKLGVRSSR